MHVVIIQAVILKIIQLITLQIFDGNFDDTQLQENWASSPQCAQRCIM